MLVSIDKQSDESLESVLKKKRKATVKRICTKERFSVWNDRMRGDGWWEWWVNGTNGRSATHTTRWVRNGEISAWLMERTRKLIPDTRGSILRGTDLLLDLLSATGTHMPYGITVLPATRQRWHSRRYLNRSWYSILRPRRDARLSWPRHCDKCAVRVQGCISHDCTPCIKKPDHFHYVPCTRWRNFVCLSAWPLTGPWLRGMIKLIASARLLYQQLTRAATVLHHPVISRQHCSCRYVYSHNW